MGRQPSYPEWAGADRKGDAVVGSGTLVTCGCAGSPVRLVCRRLSLPRKLKAASWSTGTELTSLCWCAVKNLLYYCLWRQRQQHHYAANLETCGSHLEFGSCHVVELEIYQRSEWLCSLYEMPTYFTEGQIWRVPNRKQTYFGPDMISEQFWF